mgnify:CR=1 FL=1
MRQIAYLVLVLLFVSAAFSVRGQQESISSLPDSLRNVLDATKGAEKVRLLLRLSQNYSEVNTAEAVFLAEEALEEAQKLDDEDLIARATMQTGVFYRNRGDYREGISFFLKTLDYAKSTGNKKLQAEALHKMASSHLWLFEYSESLNYARREVALWEEIGDTKGLAKALNLNGLVLANLGEYESAFTILKKSLQLATRLENEDLLYKTKLNIGDTHLKNGDPEKALEWMQESYAITQRMGSRFGQAITELKIGQAQAALENYDAAIGSLREGIEKAKAIKASSVVRNGYKYMMETYQQRGDYESAFQFLQKYQTLSDSLLTAENRRNIEQLKAQYKIEEKESENELLREQNRIQNYQSYLLGTFSLLGLSLGFLLWRRYREKTQANAVLQEQNQEIQEKSDKIAEQSRLLERKNQAIKDSVNYARRIQNAVQINETTLFERFPDYFILSYPRDIVSGDVYWFEQVGEHYFFAVADCTGHGIPGAFMTILCNSLLNDILKDHPDFSPQEMLYELDERLKNTLHQRVSNINDGLEIALCRLHPQQQEITYVGAKMPLFHYNAAGERTIRQPSVFPIGGHEFKSEKTFEETTFSFAQGDAIYMASDGYQDQFGGPKGRKFLRKNFRKLLDEIQSLPMSEQRVVLDERFKKWKGDQEQTDDVMVIGMRL